MVRKQDVSDDDMPGTRSRGKRRGKRRYKVLLLLFVASVVLILAAPSVLTSRSVLLPLIDKYAGIAPLKVDFTRVSAGWFSQVGIEGLRITDGQGNEVAKVGSIQTEKSLLSWITASQNIGTVRIKDVEVDVAVANGTTSIEQAVEPLLAGQPAAPTNTTPTVYSGAIELTNAKITLRDAQHPDIWLVSIPAFETQLPGVNQVVGPTKLSATIANLEGGASGSIAADVAEAMNGDVRTFNVRAVVDRVPLAFWHVLHERLPDIPVEELAGSLSARVAGSMVDQDRWSFNIDQLSGDQLVVSAPTLLGDKPARLESVKLQGQAVLANKSLALQNTQLTTDVGGIAASGTMPWPIVTPTLTSPWMPGAQLNAEGSIDLARLVKVAESLVPMREDTRLVSGSATFKASQELNAAGAPTSKLNLQLGKLVAFAGGQQLKWDDALKLAVSAQPQGTGGVSLSGTCDAEFCKIIASGTPAEGSFSGQFDLDRLQQRLAQWVELPVGEMAGQAALNLQWSQSEPGIVSAQGRLETSPLVIGMTTGGQLREPAWKGSFTATARLDGTQLASVQRAHLELAADNEKLKIDLLEPLDLIAKSAAPASFTVSSDGTLELWQKRAVMLKVLDAGTTMGGKYSLGASGRIDLAHLELREANWRCQPFEVGSSGTSLLEPEMIGNFQGNVNTKDLSQLAIEKLIVQAHSFSISAADKAGTGAEGRIGTGAYIVDVGALMRNVKSEPTLSNQLVLPQGLGTPAAAPNSQLAFQGQVAGNLRWQVNAQTATLEMDAKSEQVDVIQQVAGAQPTRLWSEAQVEAGLKALYEMSSGNVKVDSMQLKAPWVNYVGTAQVENKGKEQTIRASGQCLYDAAMVATKLQPYIGNNIQLAGRKQVPVEVVLTTGGPATATSTLAGLQAATRIGWEQARVVGIDVGVADVPVSVTNGQLATNAEIPVSGGKLRWDVQSDLTSPQTVLIQKPMMVLENVAITPQMCQSWLKYVAPLIAEATSVDGRLSLTLNQARYNIANVNDQTIDGQLVIHSAVVGPGPLSNQVIGLVQQINAIRKKELASTVGSQQVWMQLPQQTIAFRMENGRVIHRDLKVSVGDVTLVSSGAVGIDGRMEINTGMPVPDDWIAKSPYLASLKGQTLQFPIRGSLTSPQLDMQFLRDFGRQAVTGAAENLLQQQLQKGLGKIFPGGMPGGLPGGLPGAGPAAGTAPDAATGAAGAAQPAAQPQGLGLPQLQQLGLPNFGLPQFGFPQQNQPAAPAQPKTP